MAYVSKENKDSKAPLLRALAKQYGLTATVAVHHHSTLQLNISKGKIDFIGNYAERVNEINYWSADKEKDLAYNKSKTNMQVSHFSTENFTGLAAEFLEKAFAILYAGNHNNSDIMTDYFDVGWYVDINIGKWNKPYTLV